METRTYQVYKYDELTDEQKEKVLEKHYDINVDHDWWNFTYEDAKNIGLKLEGFDLDRNRHCEGKFITTARECAEKILKEHGDKCETYKTAEAYLKERKDIEQNATMDEWGEYNSTITDNLDTLADEFLKDLREDYSIILQREYEYLTSREAIEETLRANDFDFTDDGKID